MSDLGCQNGQNYHNGLQEWSLNCWIEYHYVFHMHISHVATVNLIFSGPRLRRRQFCGHAAYKARPLCRSHNDKASILRFATERFIRSSRWIIIQSKYSTPISEKTQNMTKTSIFCRFISFDDSKRHFYRIVKTNYLMAPAGRLVLVKLMVATLSIRSLSFRSFMIE